MKQELIDRTIKILGDKNKVKQEYHIKNIPISFSKVAKQAKFLAENDDAVKALALVKKMSDSELKAFVDKHLKN